MTPKSRITFGRPGCRREDNIKLDLQDTGGGMEWIDLAQDKTKWWAPANAVMKLRVP